VRWRLTGTFATDPTEASASRLFDLRRGAWSADLARRFLVPAGALPPVVPSAREAGRVSAEGARATGLPPGTPVAAGAGDNEAAALGAAALGAGRVAVILGTSGTVVATAPRRGPVGGLSFGAHVEAGTISATGTVLSAGRALEWIRAAAFPAEATAADVLRAAEASESDGGLVFLPHLVGERSPVPDPGATGAFVGLRPGHGRGHLARAVVEGVALSLGGVVRLLGRAGVRARELRATSGGAASPFWRGLVGAAAGVTVREAGARDGPAAGAAILAAALDRRTRSLRALAESWVPLGVAEAPSAQEVARLAALGRAQERARRGLRGARRGR
jgi:xylulokinase